MAARLVHVAAAAGAALLAAAALRTVHAEVSYEAGLACAPDSQTNPGSDVPGRLEFYEEAARRDPREALYALRAGQIRLHRAAPRGAPVNREELDAARTLLEHAAELRPLSAAVHATLAHLHILARDPAAAAAEAWTGLRTGPRDPGALGTAVSVGLDAWRATGDPVHLRLALTGGAGIERIGETFFFSEIDRAFAAAGPGLAGDLFEASSGDAELRAFAADRARASRPEVAKLLSDAAGTGGN